MFLLSVLAFLVMHFSLSIQLQGDGNRFSGDTTVAQVQERLDAALAGLDGARKDANADAAQGLDRAEQMLRGQAEQRIADLTTTESAPSEPDIDSIATSAPADRTPVIRATAHEQVSIPPDTAPSPVSGSDKPKISALGARMEAKLQLVFRDAPARQRLAATIFNALPPAMLVSLPLFALLLKFTYISRRRLYVEHLIVALHSHAFIFLSLLLLALLGLLGYWLAPRVGWAGAPLHGLRVAIGIWLPLYLLLMQKRVYGQGWLVTVLKYGFVGTCYSILLFLTLTGVVMFGLERV